MLQRLKPNKASGPDQIPIRLLKSASDEIAPVLCSILQQSLDNGELPQDWKHALVTPTYKKNGRQNPGNYRPISLTSVSCKLLEHIISSHIMNHLNKYDLLCPFQHGFRHHHSTETQLILTIHELSPSINRGNQVHLALLDFLKAFDKVPYKRLLIKFDYYGIRGQAGYASSVQTELK